MPYADPNSPAAEVSKKRRQQRHYVKHLALKRAKYAAWYEKNKARRREDARANRESRRKAEKKWRDENRAAKRAHDAVHYALKTGRLVKAKNCSECGEETENLHAHHHNGYSKEHRLDIVWLCHPCHNRTRRKGLTEYAAKTVRGTD